MPTIQADQLQSLSENLLIAAGATAHDAKQISSSLVMGNLTGHDSHGINMLPPYISRIKRGVIKPGAKIEIVKDTPVYALVNGNWNFGQLIASFCMDLAITKAQVSGISIVSAINCNHTGRLGEYCSTAVAKGLVAIMMVNAPPSVAPWGGAKRRLGTNPICVAIPSKEGRPIVLDMATSIVANGKVSLKVGTGERIPEGWAIDANGKPTTKPEDFEKGGSMLPFGTYKGFGLGLVIDILCGALGGSGGCNKISKDGVNGVLMIVMRTDIFVSEQEFHSSVNDILNFVLDCPLQRGFQEILIPGDPELRALRERSRNGIVLSDVLWSKLKKSADELGVTFG